MVTIHRQNDIYAQEYFRWNLINLLGTFYRKNDLFEKNQVKGLLGTFYRKNDLFEKDQLKGLLGTFYRKNDLFEKDQVKCLLGTFYRKNDLFEKDQLKGLFNRNEFSNVLKDNWNPRIICSRWYK